MTMPEGAHAERSRWGRGTVARLAVTGLFTLVATALGWLTYARLPMSGPFHKGFLSPDLWQDPGFWLTQRGAALVLFLCLVGALVVRYRSAASWRLLSWVVLVLALVLAVLAGADWWYAIGHAHPFR